MTTSYIPGSNGPSAPATDGLAFKTAMRMQWDAAADGWNSHTPKIRAWLAPATDAMLGMAGVIPGSRVLDIAAGTGDQTLEISKRVGPQGYVLATDISPGVVAFAKENATRAGRANVHTKVADGENLQVEAASFDAAICRLGLMFFLIPYGACEKCIKLSVQEAAHARWCSQFPTEIPA